MPFYKVSDLQYKDVYPGFRTRMMQSEKMIFSYLEAEAGAVLPEDAGIDEQVVHLLEGEFELTINGETKRISAGEIAVIPANTKHSGKAITNCRFLDIHPLPKD